MTVRADNPFSITKSNDLTDEQIQQLWVSVTEDDGITGLSRPTSRTAMFILGGKGSGKSHLMRYYSFPVQAIRYRQSGTSLANGLSSDGYVGVYARCGGLNSTRFQGKGLSEEVWSDLFAYYFELWVADNTLAVISSLVDDGAISTERDATIGAGINDLIDRQVERFQGVSAARDFFARIRREIDYAVNNAAFVNEVSAEILVTRGRLFFGIPSIVCSNVPFLSGAVFLYLLDEFENFSVDRQIYINTLLREREGPVAFKIGTRLYGRRSLLTLSGGERNLLGSEYEDLYLDERFRIKWDAYERFALKLISRRLDLSNGRNSAVQEDKAHLYGFFVEPHLDWNTLARDILPRRSLADRPHLINLRQKLIRGLRDGLVVGPGTDADVAAVVEAVSFPEFPVLEKLCILHVFQKWFRGGDVVEAARYARERASAKISGSKNAKFDEFVFKHKADMIAQVLRESGQKQIYAGLENFIRMSEGLPRTLITILKHVYDWATYIGEDPFRHGRISTESQQRGVLKAADLFLEQMLPTGEDGVRVGLAIERLSELFRINRFSDKPVETSLMAFSVGQFDLGPEARVVLDLAMKTSLIIAVQGGQRERNSKGVTSKFEINRMLSPRRDLPIARRGIAPLDAAEAESIFVENKREEFESLAKSWARKMTGPSFGRTRIRRSGRHAQADFFE